MPQLDLLCNSLNFQNISCFKLFALLGHPNVKLFVSHGGLMGTEEATYCGVPKLGIPIFADQFMNIMSGEAKGLAIKLSYENITKENVYYAVKELLENPK